jgi:hypothetical protein
MVHRVNVCTEIPAMIDPSATINYPSATINYPSATINYPSATINYPSATINYPSATINYPSATINYPSATINYPSATGSIILGISVCIWSVFMYVYHALLLLLGGMRSVGYYTTHQRFEKYT